MMHSQSDDRSKTRAAYFNMLAEMGVTKHIGSLATTDALVKGCHINADSLVLDAGCGIGLTPCYLTRTYGCRVVGVDITPKMIVRAQDEAERRNVGDRVQWAVADAQALPFAAGSFDAVMVESVSVFFDDPALGFREYARVTKPGGYVGVTESTWLEAPMEDVDAFFDTLGGTAKTYEAWMALMAQAGLADVTGYAQRADVREEACGRLKRFGCRGLLRALVRAVPAILGNRDARRVLKQAMAAAPARVLVLMGYGVYVGRKPSTLV